MDRGPEEMRYEGEREGADVSPEVRERLSRSRGEIGQDPSRVEDELEILRLDLARTRAQMSETVYALQSRANPDYIRHQAAEQVRSTARNSGVARTIRENPVPAALTGAGLVGLGWLITSAKKQDQDERGDRGAGQRRLSEARYGEEPHRGGHPYDNSIGHEDYREESSESSGSSSGNGEQARQRASEAGDQAKAQAREKAQRARGGFDRALRENPLAVGLAAVGIGAAVGLAIPGTARENDLMGETRDRLANQAQRQAQDSTRKAQRVIGEARESAKKEASEQDLAE